jgi:hypothetical protein
MPGHPSVDRKIFEKNRLVWTDSNGEVCGMREYDSDRGELGRDVAEGHWRTANRPLFVNKVGRPYASCRKAFKRDCGRCAMH